MILYTPYWEKRPTISYVFPAPVLFSTNDFTLQQSQASVTDLNKEIDRARSVSISQSQTRGGSGGPSAPGDVLRELLFTLPGGAGGEMSRDLDAVERIRAGPASGGKPPDEMSPQELHAVLWQVLTFRDSVMKKISKTIGELALSFIFYCMGG